MVLNVLVYGCVVMRILYVFMLIRLLGIYCSFLTCQNIYLLNKTADRKKDRCNLVIDVVLTNLNPKSYFVDFKLQRFYLKYKAILQKLILICYPWKNPAYRFYAKIFTIINCPLQFQLFHFLKLKEFNLIRLHLFPFFIKFRHSSHQSSLAKTPRVLILSNNIMS